MTRNERRAAWVGGLAMMAALAGATTDAYERRHPAIAAAFDASDPSAGGPALGLAIASQGNQALLDIRAESLRGLALPPLPPFKSAAIEPAQ